MKQDKEKVFKAEWEKHNIGMMKVNVHRALMKDQNKVIEAREAAKETAGADARKKEEMNIIQDQVFTRHTGQCFAYVISFNEEFGTVLFSLTNHAKEFPMCKEIELDLKEDVGALQYWTYAHIQENIKKVIKDLIMSMAKDLKSDYPPRFTTHLIEKIRNVCQEAAKMGLNP